MKEEQLRAIVRARVRSGELPAISINQILGGRGSHHHACVCCDRLIEPHEIEYEIQSAWANELPGQTFTAHPQCYWIWWEEIGTPE